MKSEESTHLLKRDLNQPQTYGIVKTLSEDAFALLSKDNQRAEILKMFGGYKPISKNNEKMAVHINQHNKIVDLAVNTFCNEPIPQAFDLYNKIKQKVDGLYNIAYIYQLPEQKRTITLQAICLRNSPTPIQNISGFIFEDSDEEEECECTTFCRDKCTPKNVCLCGLFGSACIFSSVIGAGGTSLLCSPSVVKVGVIPACLGFMWWAWKEEIADTIEDVVDKKRDSFV